MPFCHGKFFLACIGLVLLAACDAFFSPEQRLFIAVERMDTKMVKELLASGKIKNIDEIMGGWGMTPLEVAILRRHYDAITLLIAAGANVNHKTADLETPVHFAAYYGDAKAAQMLIAAGADVNAALQTNSFRPLHEALRKDHLDVAKLLVEAGADPFLKTDDGRDAFFIAKRGGHHEFLEWLSRRGESKGPGSISYKYRA